MPLKFKVELIQEPDGGYIAHVPALPGCHTQGDSFDEVIENVKDAIQLYMDVLSEESTISPTNSQSQIVEVSI
jgi:predicted RNase H-like HicB family nuclease